MINEDSLYPVYISSFPPWLRPWTETPAMQRLKEIGMNCGLEYTRYPIYRHLTKPYSRYEHSVGTALIVWHFTQDPAQTIAALLHDVSTPVFAHVIDFLNEDHLTQESTEGSTRLLIEQSPEDVYKRQRWMSSICARSPAPTSSASATRRESRRRCLFHP